MFDIEEFRSFAIGHRWTASSGFEGPHGLYLMEPEAKTLIDKIDRLEDIFSDVINKLDEIKEEYAITFYHDRIKSIKDTYIEKNVKAQIEVFENQICTKRKGHYDYRRIKEKANREGISGSEDYNKFLAKCFVENFDKLPNYTSKANYIAYFEETVKQYFLYDTLFERLNKNQLNVTIKKDPTLKELFPVDDVNLFEDIVELLLSKNIISKLGKGYRWDGTINFVAEDDDLNSDQYATLKKLKLLMAFGYVLESKGYLKSSNVKISKALGVFFNEKVNPTTYGQVKKEFKGLTNSGQSRPPYLTIFNFIPTLK